MATSLLVSLFFFSFASLFSSSMPLSCSSFSFSNNRTFISCSSLPHLHATIHWTFDPSTSSLSLAFSAPPPSSSGWIAWAINPNSLAMIGSQALIAFNDPTIKPQTFNITGYSPIKPSPIDFPTSDLQSESSSTHLTLFAKLKLPQGLTSINQVWQVGTSVTSGLPDKHEMLPDNLQSMSKLDLTKGQRVTTATSPAPAPPSSPPSAAAGSHRLLSKVRAGVLFFIELFFFFIYLF
ncbi:DOMON domain-containing protein [Dioscorea alata]|uniref:DOMON domain-containing protein n=1 Tax=Dioscorea alata TaxID=55571 RepID=A0ACB7WAW4_DIOAL|nr:DOMON domain-containing protein [Dioscorea alata]